MQCILEGTCSWRIGNQSFVHIHLIGGFEVKHSPILVHFIPITVHLDILLVCWSLNQVGILLGDLGERRCLLGWYWWLLYCWQLCPIHLCIDLLLRRNGCLLLRSDGRTLLPIELIGSYLFRISSGLLAYPLIRYEVGILLCGFHHSMRVRHWQPLRLCRWFGYRLSQILLLTHFLLIASRLVIFDTISWLVINCVLIGGLWKNVPLVLLY